MANRAIMHMIYPTPVLITFQMREMAIAVEIPEDPDV